VKPITSSFDIEGVDVSSRMADQARDAHPARTFAIAELFAVAARLRRGPRATEAHPQAFVLARRPL
jgi:hypothetical protein